MSVNKTEILQYVENIIKARYAWHYLKSTNRYSGGSKLMNKTI